MVKAGYKSFLNAPMIYSTHIPKGAIQLSFDVDMLDLLKSKIKKLGEFIEIEFSYQRFRLNPKDSLDEFLLMLNASTKKPMSPEFWKEVKRISEDELKDKKVVTFFKPTGYEEVK